MRCDRFWSVPDSLGLECVGPISGQDCPFPQEHLEDSHSRQLAVHWRRRGWPPSLWAGVGCFQVLPEGLWQLSCCCRSFREALASTRVRHALTIQASETVEGLVKGSRASVQFYSPWRIRQTGCSPNRKFPLALLWRVLAVLGLAKQAVGPTRSRHARSCIACQERLGLSRNCWWRRIYLSSPLVS